MNGKYGCNIRNYGGFQTPAGFFLMENRPFEKIVKITEVSLKLQMVGNKKVA